MAHITIMPLIILVIVLTVLASRCSSMGLRLDHQWMLIDTGTDSSYYSLLSENFLCLCV